MDIKASSAAEALRICADLHRTGKASLFRGQTRDWPTLAPTLFRLNSTDQDRSATKLARFREWANAVPQMAFYRDRPEDLTAIAQHYGIPTTFLDFTDSPEIALLFAKREHQTTEGAANAVVYCFAESELTLLSNAQILRLDVANLWRLEAQNGLFLDFLDGSLSSQLRSMGTRVHFPSELLTEEERTRLYPVRKSALENVLDQWFYRHEVEDLMKNFATIKRMSLKRHSYPGAFVWRQIPDVSPEWLGEHGNWFLPPIETVSILSSRKVVTVPALKGADIKLSMARAREKIEAPIRASIESGNLLSFEIERKGRSKLPLLAGAAQLLNRVWDGIRGMPYSGDELVACMSLCAALVSLRAHGVKVDNWEEWLWGDTELFEVAPLGGHIEAGRVSQVHLARAYSTQYRNVLANPFRRLASENPRELMSYIVEPFILFEFEPFKRIFVEQFIPSAIDIYWKEDIKMYDGQLKCLWSIPFNPALLGYVTNGDFRFRSPLPLEKDPSRIVYILPDMTQAEIEETFVYCLPQILAGGEPFQVRFQGYAFDERQIWEIEQAIQQCKDIVSVSGISVLEVFTLFQEPSESRKPGDRPGLGAFEVWLIARGLMSQVLGQSIEIQLLLPEFWEELMHANAYLESRAARWQQKEAQNT